MLGRTAKHLNRRRLLILVIGFALMGATTSHGLSLHQLESDPGLTPKRFSQKFASFGFELFDEVQMPNEFLRGRTGDCDDYACLADLVLKPKGYDTRLIQIRLAGMTSHAVCYVVGSKAYLDYNNRAVFFTMTRSAPELRQVARKVAHSLSANWTAAYEFQYSYEENRKRIMAVVVRAKSSKEDPPPWRPSSSRHHDRFKVD